jgi:SAM-dependent methyltransferase
MTFPNNIPLLQAFWQDAFNLKQHLQDFLGLDPAALEQRLQQSKQELAVMGHRDFDWNATDQFYSHQVGDIYLFELGAWHLASQDHIGDTLRLIHDHLQGRVLDFGGGIGTHTIAAGLCPGVTEVVYCDINPIHQQFVQYRVEQLGLADKIHCCLGEVTGEFDAIICFDVLEHLPDPTQQLMQFHKQLSPQGRIILNWYFFKGFAQEFPFHLDDPQLVEQFFLALQTHFLEIFHPYFTTARCYRQRRYS